MADPVATVEVTVPVIRPARKSRPAPDATLHLVREADEQPARLPWAPALGTALLLRSALSAVDPITNAVSGLPVPEATLKLSAWYVLFAPFCDTLDWLSMFSQRQHFAFLATCALFYAAWRALRHDSTRPVWSRVRRESVAAALALSGLVAVYAAGVMLPRPVARLAMKSADDLVVDFHSHTSFSWDGRRGFSPEANRRWHHASGFDVAYVTDHGTFAGAQGGSEGNPSRAGDATVLLSGIEVRSMGRHLNILGTSARDSVAYRSGDLDEKEFLRDRRSRNIPPVVLLTLPGSVKPVKSAIPIDAVEISDGAPRALAQIDAEKPRLLDLADRARIVMVAGSNDHGWASASPAWSVMRIAAWRSMTPPQLDIAIRRAILSRGPGVVQVVERRPPGGVASAALALTVPETAWELLTSLSWPERVSWLSWIWAGYFARRWWRMLAARIAKRKALRTRRALPSILEKAG